MNLRSAKYLLAFSVLVRLMIQTGFLSYDVFDLIDLLQYNCPSTVQIFM
jgi:hypothetical protein